MSPCDILLGHKVHWWPSIKHMAPTLHISQQSNMLRQFHRSLLPRVKFNRNFSCVLIPISLDFGGLGLKTMELEQRI